MASGLLDYPFLSTRSRLWKWCPERRSGQKSTAWGEPKIGGRRRTRAARKEAGQVPSTRISLPSKASIDKKLLCKLCKNMHSCSYCQSQFDSESQSCNYLP